MDNITVVFIAFEGFHKRGFEKGLSHTVGPASSTGSSAGLGVQEEEKIENDLVQPIFTKTGYEPRFVVDEEEMETIQYPHYCESDYNYIRGRSQTPPYLKPKPRKVAMRKFEAPTIITTNPDDLHEIPQQFPEHYYDFLKDMPEEKRESEINI